MYCRVCVCGENVFCVWGGSVVEYLCFWSSSLFPPHRLSTQHKENCHLTLLHTSNINICAQAEMLLVPSFFNFWGPIHFSQCQTKRKKHVLLVFDIGHPPKLFDLFGGRNEVGFSLVIFFLCVCCIFFFSFFFFVSQQCRAKQLIASRM